MSKKPKSKVGGARPGAGRKPRPYPREALTIRVEPEVADAFRALCDKHGLSQSEMMTKLVVAD